MQLGYKGRRNPHCCSKVSGKFGKTEYLEDKQKREIKILTANAGAKKDLQNQIASGVQDGAGCHGNESQAQVLDGLHAARQKCSKTSNSYMNKEMSKPRKINIIKQLKHVRTSHRLFPADVQAP